VRRLVDAGDVAAADVVEADDGFTDRARKQMYDYAIPQRA
jgi:hypothetical protein